VRGANGPFGIGDDQHASVGGEQRSQPGRERPPLEPRQVLVAQDERERAAAQRERHLLRQRSRAPRHVGDDEQAVFHGPTLSACGRWG
jgi:hypothetical protein